MRGGLVAEILQSQGWETAVCDAAGEVSLDGDPATLVVLVEESLVAGVRKMKLLGPAPERPPVIVVCEAIRPGEIRIALGAGVMGVVLSEALGSTLVSLRGRRLRRPGVRAEVAGAPGRGGLALGRASGRSSAWW